MRRLFEVNDIFICQIRIQMLEIYSCLSKPLQELLSIKNIGAYSVLAQTRCSKVQPILIQVMLANIPLGMRNTLLMLQDQALICERGRTCS